MSDNKKVADYTLTELKAMAYDELSKIESAQSNLRMINGEIQKRSRTDAESNGA
jgi:hypothetical protein